ncbi:hypothetical protein [Mesorhizobium sp. YM1C-6-2]|uniref:hypothetical protein n=1 Tax=Mesorhizobium sp. YM1C-6-2 TaxID=1827501 RepID=UPI0011C4A467|nr:hypothetical protein [Mesorhizobium sp. YM1C-6-2]
MAEAQAEEPSSEEPTGDGLARAAIAQLSYVAEALVTALECIAAGHAASSREVVGAMIQADAHLTEALRIPSDDEFKTTLRALWGREEMPVRIR